MNRKRFLALAGTVLLMGVAPRAAGELVQSDGAKTYKVAPGGRLTMRVDRGSVEIKTSSDDKVQVQITRKLKGFASGDALKEHKIDITQAGNDVTITAESPKSGLFWNRRANLQVAYTISVPKKYNIDLKTAGGGITVGDLQGEVRCATSGGSVNLGEIEGPVFARSSGGGVRVKQCGGKADVKTSGGGIQLGLMRGAVEAQTSGGSISLAGAKGYARLKTSGGGIKIEEAAGSVEAATSGGSVSARFSGQPGGPCRLSTSGGNIEVRLPEAVKADISASTSGGRVTTEFPDTRKSGHGRSSLNTKLNGGGPEMVLRTSGGGIHIRKL